MGVTRRQLLRASALGGGAFLVASPVSAAGASRLRVEAPPEIAPLERYATARRSPLLPGLQLAFTDMHNHTLFSDGDGDPAAAYVTMRDAGVDAAALTDHSTVSKALTPEGAPGLPFPCVSDDDGCDLQGIDEARWQQTRVLADRSDAPGTFTAIRGFEWSSPTLGHVNVWFSETWVDPLSTAGNTTGAGLAEFTADVGPLTPVTGPAGAALEAAFDAFGTEGLGMQGFYQWLRQAPSSPVLGGGSDGIFGFNHPGREPGRFGNFTFAADLQPRCVSLELFNRTEDYLFEGTDAGNDSPLTECLAQGWTPGLLGVTDHHGTRWGALEDNGRGGSFVTALTRDGIRESLERRLFFATREAGLRFAALARGSGGSQVPMGSELDHADGEVTFTVDVDRLPRPGSGAESLRGRTLLVQVLQTGRPLPVVVAERGVTVPSGTDPGADTTSTFSVPVDAEDGDWVVLRLVDPQGEPDPRATGDYATAGRALAYASPFYLRPQAVAPSPSPSGSPSGGPGPAPSGSPAPGGPGAAGGTGGSTAGGSASTGSGGGVAAGGSQASTGSRVLAATGGPAAVAAAGAAALAGGLAARRGAVASPGDDQLEDGPDGEVS